MSRENTKLGNCRLTTKGRVQELVIEESNFWSRAYKKISTS